MGSRAGSWYRRFGIGSPTLKARDKGHEHGEDLKGAGQDRNQASRVDEGLTTDTGFSGCRIRVRTIPCTKHKGDPDFNRKQTGGITQH